LGEATPDTTSLARYVPRLSAEWSLRTDQPWREIDGTLCYIDISGFTALSEKLARRGRIGAEELTEVLNYVFGKMLAVAYDRGGSLLKFGGDALLLIFTGPDHPTQAASAAIEMQAVLREARSYETSAGRLSLKMSVGLHSGTVHLFRVGDSHQELILTGPAASMTTEMEETAVAGEVLISSATHDAISGNGMKPKGHGFLLNWRKARIECCGWSPRIKLDPGAIAEGMPVALRDFLSHGRAEAEHHIATVGFIKYTGVDALMEQGGPAAVAKALDELVLNVQHAVDAEGVTFLASDIDEDGGKIILVAGVPGVQEDDEGRVLRAARSIIDHTGTLTIRIGINQGHVFVGEIGTDFRATYTIMGDTVNLAARLMAAASPGEIYASPSALDRSLTLFETTPLEPFYVKGKEHPVQAYAVGAETGRRPSERGGSLPFAGRTDELAKLNAMIDDLFAGKGNAVAIVGERGIGKSRLVDEILPSLEKAERIDIRAEPYGIGTPYRPLRDPIRRLLGVERAEPPVMAKALTESIERLAPEHATLAPLVADVAMIDMPSTSEVDEIDPRFRQDRTADLLIELFAQAFDGPVFFEVEDGNYMDEASSHIMERIAAATAEHPWLVLTTRRDTPDGFHPKMEEVSLGPLSDDEARRLVIVATEAAPLRPYDVDVIVQRGGGLPLFLEEIIGAVRKAGGVESLPDSLDAVVSSQIDALAPLARRLLRFSSVLGRSFRISMLNQLMEDEGIRLDAATRRELSGLLDPDGRDRLRFRHAMIRDVAYRGLSFKRRRELHLQAGEIAEEAAGDHPESAADVLALHFSLAQDHERAWRYSLMAGDQAREAFANVDAASHYERALRAARTLDLSKQEVAEVWIRLGDVRELAGLFNASLDAYQKASQLVRDDPIRKAQTLFKRARARERSGAYSSALRELTTAESLLEDQDASAASYVRARLLATRAQVYQAQEKPQEALRVATEAMTEAERSGNKEALASAYVRIDWANLFLGKPDQAVYGEKASAIYDELGDLGAKAIVISNEGFAAYFEGRWDDALRLYEEGRDAFQRAGNAVHAAHAASNIAEVLVNQERYAEAEPLVRESIRVLQASEFLDGAVFGLIQLGRALTGMGRLEEAEEVLQQAWDQAHQLGITSMSATDAATFLAECKLLSGDAKGALELLEESAPADGGDFIWQGPVVARVRAAVLAELGRSEEAVAILEAGLAGAREHGLSYELGLLLALKSQIGGPDPEAEQEAESLLGRLGVGRHLASV
jgi:class 3 adenylate cyclase/tetratricopeptide (TPR) repeat protein